MIPKKVATLKLLKTSPPKNIKARSDTIVAPAVRTVRLRVELVLEFIRSSNFIFGFFVIFSLIRS